jgi:hypothetical protein
MKLFLISCVPLRAQAAGTCFGHRRKAGSESKTRSPGFLSSQVGNPSYQSTVKG